MANEKQAEKPAAIIPILKSEIIGIFVVGALTGLVIWGLGMLLNRFIFDVYLCQGAVGSQCSENARSYSALLASILGAGLALGGLVRLRVYRPLLVVVASMLSLWGIVQLSWSFDWIIGAIAVALLYAVAFGLYSWIARIREFWISLITIILLVVAVRLALLV